MRWRRNCVNYAGRTARLCQTEGVQAGLSTDCALNATATGWPTMYAASWLMPFSAPGRAATFAPAKCATDWNAALGAVQCARRLTFEVRRDQRQDARPGLVKMYAYHQTGPGDLPLGLASTEGLGRTRVNERICVHGAATEPRLAK